jgi:hypothetical protein
VTYAQIERAATDILKTGVRPTLESVRTAVGGGSPRTILDGLNRYWRDLGNQIAGSPDTLQRLPAAVADLAEGLWEQAVKLATDAAQATSSEADTRLAQLRSQLELRTHTLSQRKGDGGAPTCRADDAEQAGRYDRHAGDPTGSVPGGN